MKMVSRKLVVEREAKNEWGSRLLRGFPSKKNVYFSFRHRNKIYDKFNFEFKPEILCEQRSNLNDITWKFYACTRSEADTSTRESRVSLTDKVSWSGRNYTAE